MSKTEHLKIVLISYFIIVTLVNAAMGIMGLCFEREQTFSYEAYFMPLIYGFLGIIPLIFTYTKKELTLKQMIFRKVFRLLFLEALLTSFVFLNHVAKVRELLWFILSVLFISVLVNLFLWWLDNLKAKELNSELVKYQKNQGNAV